MRERNVRHFEHWIWNKFRMFYSCAILFPMTAAAGLPKALPATGDCSNHCSGVHWPFKVARNCLAGISGLELWFREDNRHTILEALKVLVANLHPALFTAVPVVLDRNWKWLQQAACFEMLHAISENVILIVAIIVENSIINQHFLVLKLKKTIIFFHKSRCCTSQKLTNYGSSEPFIWFFI